MKFVVICGNDGTGKTSLVRHLNETAKERGVELYAIQRSTQPESAQLKAIKELISPKQLDKQTYVYSFQKRDSLPNQVSFRGSQSKVQWVMLDAQIVTIQRRIKHRIQISVFQSQRMLTYFQKIYRQLAYHHGMTLLPTDSLSTAELAYWLLDNHQFLGYPVDFNSLRPQQIFQNDLQKLVQLQIKNPSDMPFRHELQQDGLFDLDSLEPETHRMLAAKWLLRGSVSFQSGSVKVEREGFEIRVAAKRAIFHKIIQGQSKQIYRIVSESQRVGELVIIILKSTIYSHTKRTTSLIPEIGAIRAEASNLFLDLLYRNNMDHAYLYVNSFGLILSRLIHPCPLELVFKKYWVGTDKHSYVGLDSTALVKERDEYAEGVYVRLDWRNPNFINCKTGKNVFQNWYYFQVETLMGKDRFYKQILLDEKKCKAIGDKVISPQLASPCIADFDQVQFNIQKVYLVLSYYLEQLDLQLIDGCFMMDKDFKLFWSQINPDCLRIKSKNLDEAYDKDIWRTYGHSSKDQIKFKWEQLSKMLREYLLKNRMYPENLDYQRYPYQLRAQAILNKQSRLSQRNCCLYRSMLYSQSRRRVIFTIDLHEGKPTLVKSSTLHQTHSQGSFSQALQKLKICQQLLLVDLDGAIEIGSNRQLIKRSAAMREVMAGGGIRNGEDVRELLESGVRKVTVATNLDAQFITTIPKDRLIVQFSVDDRLQILKRGRKQQTGLSLIDEVRRLAQLGVRSISITFVSKEGRLQGLARQKIREVICQVPLSITQIIIAGGISCLQDLSFLWRFDRVIPQLGSAVWKQKISLADVLAAQVNWKNHNQLLLCEAIIFRRGQVLGLCFMNEQALKQSVKSGKVHRYSRKFKRVMLKGESSGQLMPIRRIRLDCDGDGLLIEVEGNNSFCHQQTQSCFRHSLESESKGMIQIFEHIQSKRGTGSYSAVLQEDQHKAACKLREQVGQLLHSIHNKPHQAADVLGHFLIYLSAVGLSFKEVEEELCRRSLKPSIPLAPTAPKDTMLVCIPDRRNSKLIQLARQQLGIQLLLSSEDSSVQFNIIDSIKYSQFFNSKSLKFVRTKNSSIPTLLHSGNFKLALCYDTVLVNHQVSYKTLVQVSDPSIKPSLIARQDFKVDLHSYSASNKLTVYSEHQVYFHKFLSQQKLHESAFKVVSVTGGGESLLWGEQKAICQSIVQTGRTIKSNKLYQVAILQQSISLGLYSLN